MKNAIAWLERPARNIDRSQAFYEAVLHCKMRREQIGPSVGAVFPYEGEGVGGAIMCGRSAPPLGSGGTLVYLDVSPSINAVLARVKLAGGLVAMDRTALPPGMGFIAHVTDQDGNRIGLHSSE
jgi:uncharacterized protein